MRFFFAAMVGFLPSVVSFVVVVVAVNRSGQLPAGGRREVRAAVPWPWRA
jgi:hypothetical protein